MVEAAATSLDIASERIARIRSDRWIAYPRAMQAIDPLHELFEYPKRLRMPNLLIVGPTNNGKSMIAEKFARRHRARGAQGPGRRRRGPGSLRPNRLAAGIGTATRDRAARHPARDRAPVPWRPGKHPGRHPGES